MKKYLVIFFLLTLCLTLFAQKSEYSTKVDISYYADSIRATDKYIAERCKLDVYFPKKEKGFPTIVWFHGGGLSAGNKEIPSALKEKGVCVVAVNYRLYPKIKSPEYIKDAAAAVAWVFKNINKSGGDSSLIFLSGHSAGGYLVNMIGLDKRWLSANGIDANKIAGLIPFSGHAITHFAIREERGIPGTTPVVDDLAPLYHVRPDAPPLLLITGDRELELLGRYEENAYLMRMMKEAGHKQTRLLELAGYDHNMVAPAFPLLLKEVFRIVKDKSSLKK